MTEHDQDDKLPPHSVEDEQGIIACVLQDSEACLADCMTLTEGHFYDALHKIVWRAILAVAKANIPVDSITVSRWLTDNKAIESPSMEINRLSDCTPSPSNLPTYLPRVHDFNLRRRIIKGCSVITDQAMNGHTTEQVMATCEKMLAIQPPNACQILDGTLAGGKMIDDLQRRYELHGALPGLDTGFHGLNNLLDGLQYGEQTLIAARPSIGKTAIGLNVFHNAIFNLSTPSLFVSLEMSAESLMRRMMSATTGVTMSTIRRGVYNEGEFDKFTRFRIAAAKVPMHILDGVSGMGISELCASVRRHVRRNEIKLVVVDYLQKIRCDSKHEKRTYEVADVSGRLRALAVETRAAFLTLAQLNRESEKDKGRLPRLSDLADSGQIERDADTVILLHRDRGEPNGEASLIVAKQRDGETGLVKLHFNGTLCRFENAGKIDQSDRPHTPHPND